MSFEWDRTKAAANLRQHDASFEEAESVFRDPLAATFDDPDHSLGEHRFITIGYKPEQRLLLVVHTEEGDTIRIISARPATANERKKHEA